MGTESDIEIGKEYEVKFGVSSFGEKNPDPRVSHRTISEDPEYFDALLSSSHFTERSEWVCGLYGGMPFCEGITWQPLKGKHPNWFWRKMQYLCFGNRWEKVK